jgi:hypothetical protein
MRSGAEFVEGDPPHATRRAAEQAFAALSLREVGKGAERMIE